jgi:hypothetical protein
VAPAEELVVTRKNGVLLLVAAACFGPFFVAVILFYGPWSHDWLPKLPGTREWISPPIALPQDWRADLAAQLPPVHRWSLIYAKMAACDAICAEDLTRMRQVQRALARDADRVEVVFADLGAGNPPPQIAGEPLEVRRLAGEARDQLRAALGEERLEAGSVLLADSRGDLVLSYPRDVAQRELLRDLKRLLSGTGTDQ